MAHKCCNSETQKGTTIKPWDLNLSEIPINASFQYDELSADCRESNLERLFLLVKIISRYI